MLFDEGEGRGKYYNEADCEGTPQEYWIRVARKNWLRINQLNDPCPRSKRWCHYLNYNFLYATVPEGCHYLNPPFSRYPVIWMWLLLQHSTGTRSFSILSTEKRCKDPTVDKYYLPNIDIKRIIGMTFTGYDKDLAASLREMQLWSPDHIDYVEHMNS
jgi:hypothetical protein